MAYNVLKPPCKRWLCHVFFTYKYTFNEARPDVSLNTGRITPVALWRAKGMAGTSKGQNSRKFRVDGYATTKNIYYRLHQT